MSKKNSKNFYSKFDTNQLLELAISTKNDLEKNLIEDAIAECPWDSYKYAMEYLHGRFLKGESIICKKLSVDILFNYLKVLVRGRWEVAEKAFAKRPDTAFQYAEYIKAPFPLGEIKIAKVSTWAYRYATEVLKRKWPEGEDGIAKGIENSYFYAKFISEKHGIDKFEKGEPTLMKNGAYAFHYAKNILKRRWIEAEPYIEKTPHFNNHYKRFLEILEGKRIYNDSEEK